MKRAHIAMVLLAGVVAGSLVAHFIKNRAAAPSQLEHATLVAEPRALPVR